MSKASVSKSGVSKKKKITNVDKQNDYIYIYTATSINVVGS